MSYRILLHKFYRTNPTFIIQSRAKFIRKFSSDILPSCAIIPPSTSNLTRSEKKKLTDFRDQIESLQFNTPIPTCPRRLLRKTTVPSSFKQPSTEKIADFEVKDGSALQLRAAFKASCQKDKPQKGSCPNKCTKKECAAKCKCKSISPFGMGKKSGKQSKKNKKKGKKSGPRIIFSFFWLIIKSALAVGVINTTIFLKVWGSADDTNKLVNSLRESGYLPKRASDKDFNDNPKDVSIEFQEEINKFKDAFSNMALEVHKVPEKILQLYYFTENYFKNKSKGRGENTKGKLIDDDCDD